MASEHSAVATSTAPRPLPQYSQAIKHNGLLYTSGSIGVDPTTGNLVDGTTKDRARQALRNLEQVIEAGGSSLDRVLKANIFLDDMTNFALVNEAWDEFFTTLPKPVSLVPSTARLEADGAVDRLEPVLRSTNCHGERMSRSRCLRLPVPWLWGRSSEL